MMSKKNQYIKPIPQKRKNEVKNSQANKITNNSTNTYTNTNKSKTNFKQLLSNSQFSHFQKSTNVNYSMYEGAKKSKGQNHKSEQKVASAKVSASKETKRVINTSEKKRSSPKEQAKNKKQLYEVMKFNELTTNKNTNPQSNEVTHERNKSSILCTPKPSKYSNQSQTQILSGIQQVQSERIENLKKYLHEDTERLTKIKRVSDAHIIQQLTHSQQNLQQTLQESLTQVRTLQIQHYKQIEQVRENYEKILDQKKKEIENLLYQLRQQKVARVKSDVLLKQSDVKMRCIKEKLEQKENLCKKLYQTLQNEKRLKQSIEVQLQDSLKERKSIKKQVQQVLNAVREEIKYQTAEINSQ